jgi:acyl carrier protein
MEDKKIKIRGFLARFSRNHQINDDADIFASGAIHSLVALQLINFIEKEFEIVVADEDLEPDNFRSINNIVAFIERKAAPVL